ncbi:MAG: beta-propeller fold lactonase family protein, partial [Bacteroidetes bacterium]|nr:beta-propeller fold lactonase family protein [Bacteroidota bacterium]
YAESKPGMGPRHIVFHPSLPYAYLVEEMGGMVSVFSYKNGKLKTLQHIDAYPEGYKDLRASADIHLTPDGRFLYVSNRGAANNIAIYSVNASSGKLKTVGFQPTLGVTPRNFMIDPTGNWLLAANQDSDNVVVFKRNTSTGLLEANGVQVHVPRPVCLKMLEIK